MQHGKRIRTIVIREPELCIVPETLADAESIYQYLGCDPEIAKYTGWNPYRTLQDTVEKIEKDIYAEDGSYSWVIKKDDAFVGTIGAYDYNDEDSSVEIGYSIARHCWGNGYAGAAVKAVVSFLLDEVCVQSVRAWSHKDNVASIKVLLAAGFEETGREGEQITFVRNNR